MDQYIITHDQLKRIVEIQPSLIDIAKTIQKQSISDTEDCPLCGASMEKRWCNLSPLLVKILVKAYSIVVASNQNRFRLTDLDLDPNMYNNFQKLRYHALIAKYKENGEHQKAYWLLTRRCGQFLRGELAIPRRVRTFRNHVIEHDPDLVKVRDVIGSEPYVQTDFPGEVLEQKTLLEIEE